MAARLDADGEPTVDAMDDARLWELQAGRALMNPTTPERVLAAARQAEG